MKPTVYLPLADLCPTGVRRASASTIGRFSAGRVSTHRLWIEMDGSQASQSEQRNEAAGGRGKKHSP
jgi:hypothetical protein